ncbi:hypothetical protein [Saccharospirillum sp. MSK14-1]|uniref:hypothetical protein n=1 Tax=Saccharospirillum sp. MSK14-1 TaxID=1897632 RepID=UPI0011B1F6B1|nr:hypothetical protein [Saccharospirillum sp. MSK14-1]
MIRKLSVCALLWAASSLCLAQNLLLVTDLDDDNLASRPDLRLVASEAINQLRDYQVSTAKTSERPDSQAKITAMVDAARRADLTTVAVVTLYPHGWGSSTLTTSFYGVSNGELQMQRSLDFNTRDVQSILAQLEYELPLMLKREFRELGSVVRVTADRLYFDLGESAGVEVGQLYRVFRRGEEIRDSRGESYGFVDNQTGIIEVTSVSGVYSVGEIKLGRLSIRNNDWVEMTAPDIRVEGEVLSKLDNEVAINLGRLSGISAGSYFAIYKDIKPIDSEQSFREMVGQIRINEVNDNVARGEIARSDHYDLAKALIEEGDRVEEVAYRHRNQLEVGQNLFGILNNLDQSYFVGLRFDSNSDIDLGYRLRASVVEPYYGSIGLVSALNHSESFRYGLDGLYGPDGLGTQLFVEADIPTPLSERARFSLEGGYLLGGIEAAEGLNISLSVKLGLVSLL